MKKVDKETLKLAAQHLMFEMSYEEYESLLADFDSIISKMKILGEIEGIDDVEPMTFPFDVTNSYLREDIAGEPLTREDALKNAKDIHNGMIGLPRVVK